MATTVCGIHGLTHGPACDGCAREAAEQEAKDARDLDARAAWTLFAAARLGSGDDYYSPGQAADSADMMLEEWRKRWQT